MDLPAKHLLFHASIVLLTGLLCGALYGQAIVKQKSENIVRAWKLAHGALSLGATTMIAVSSILSDLPVNLGFQWIIAIIFILSGYGFCFALTLEPFADGRGLAWRGTRLNKAVFIGNVIGALSSLIGAMMLTISSFVAIY